MGQVSFNSTHTSIWNRQFEQPAFVGVNSVWRTVVTYRSQWTKLEGAPQTFYLGSDIKLPLKNIGGGIFISHDRVGATAFTNAKLALSYSKHFQKSFLSAGVNFGMVNMMLNGNKITTPSSNVGVQDPLLGEGKESGVRPDIGLGMAYVHPIFEIDAFVNNVANFITTLDGDSKELNLTFGRLMGISTQFNLAMGSSPFVLNPVVLMKTDFNKYQIDAFLTTTYEKKYTFGLGYRGYNKNSSESLIILSRLSIIDNLFVSYSYDMSLNKLKNVNKGSHELSLEYNLPINYISNKSKVINHPRFL
ncbi:MAG: PorP/SprF family type IX secretion system membrane protein [Chitinophagales bacterium]|nr:PorP/SprF family type IX secretion system membrane protein [Chitinophagales bacterium]